MWRRGGRSTALDRAQVLLSSRGNGRVSPGESAQRFLPEETWQQTNARSAPSNTHTLPSDVSDLSSVSSASDHGAVVKIQERPGGSPKHLRPQSSLAGGLSDGGGGTGGSRFLKKKALPTDALSSRSSQLVSKGQLEQQQQQPPPPHLRGSQTAALSRLADLESRIRGRKPAGQVPKPASDLILSPAPSSPAPAAAAQPLGPSAATAAQPLGLSPPSSDEQSLKGKRFLKSNRASGVKAGQPAGPGVGMGPRPGAADGPQPSASTEMRRLTGVSLESDEEDMKKLLGDSLDSVNSYFTRARPKSSKTAHEMEGRHSRSFSTTPHPPAAIPPSPPSSPSVPTPRSPASPFRFTGHTQAQFSSSTFSPPPSPPHASPSPAGSPQRPLSSMSSNSVILSLAELFPVGSQEPRSDTSLASTNDFKINAFTLDDLVPVKLNSTEETADKEQGEQNSASHSLAIQQHHQQQLRHDNNQEEAPDYESDFESESRRTDVKEVQLSERRLGQNDDEEEEAEPVSEVMEGVSNVSRGSEEVVYSDTFSDVSSSYTSRSSDHSGGRSSRASRSCDGRLEGRDSTRKVFKDAVVQTQLAPPTYSWPAGLSPAGGEAFPDPTPVITHLSAETVEAIGSFNPSAFVLTELLKQQLAATKRFIGSNRQLHDSLLRSLEPPNYRYTTLEDTRELIRKYRPTVRGLDE